MQARRFMIKHLISAAVLLMLASTTLGTTWLYNDPLSFPISQHYSANTAFNITDTALTRIAGFTYYSTLGEDFYMRAIPVDYTNVTNSIMITSAGKGTASFLASPTFDGHAENNLLYAKDKSSFRVGGQGSWTNLSQ